MADLEREFEINLSHVKVMLKYGAKTNKGEDKKHNDKVFATLRTATPEMLMALIGLTSLDTAQRLARGLERMKN